MRVRISAPLALALIAIFAGCTPLKRWAYEGFGRDHWQKPNEVIRALEIRSGQDIADLGAGTGYFTFRLAQAVGPAGKVYAVDIDREMIDYLKRRVAEEKAANVVPILGKTDDPLLPEGAIDLIFVCNTYHHIENRADYFRRVLRYLKPSGRVVIIDFNGKGWFERWFIHIVPRDVVHNEMKAAGYRLVREHGFLPRQYFLVFSKS